MSLTTAFELGLVRPVIQSIADILAGGISVTVIPEVREPFINLPGLRSYWPMSIVDFLGNAKDHSGASSDLARVGTPTFSYDGNAYVQTGSGTDYLQGSTAAQDVTGVESWIDPAIRGLTFGCWAKFDSLPPSFAGISGIWPGASQYSYALYLNSTGTISCRVSGNGSVTVGTASVAQPLDEWIYVVGRYIPSTEVAIFTNSVKVRNLTSIPASLHNSTAPFEIGRAASIAAGILDGKLRDAFICQALLTDVQIENLRLSSLPST